MIKLSSPSQAAHRFVRVKIDQRALDNKVYHVSGGKEHKNDYYHFLHLANGRFLLIKAHSEDIPQEINENNGRSRELTMKEQQVMALLADLANRVPWAIVGFTPQLAAAWKKNKNEVIAAVEAKKKEMMERQEGAAPSAPTA